MKKEELLKKVASLLKIDEAKFTEALAADDGVEFDIDIPDDGVFLTSKELDNVKNTEYANGKKAGPEMEIKEYAKKHELDFKGRTLEGLIEASNKKALAEASIPENEQVAQLKKNLQKVQMAFDEREALISEKDTAISKAKLEAKLYKDVPSLGEGYLDTSSVLTLMEKDGYGVGEHEGQLVLTKNGEVETDVKSQPIPLKDGMITYSDSKGLKFAPNPDKPDLANGRGGKDGGKKPVFTKMSEVEAHLEAQGKSKNGSEALQLVREAKAEYPEFDAHS